MFVDQGIVRPQIQSYQIDLADSSLLGYTFDAYGETGSHSVQVLSSWSDAERSARLMRMACHFLVDSTPDEGVIELFEKTQEITQYYCSLANWAQPSLPAVTDLGMSVVAESYERESFAFPEE
jgi:hypothetical protein